ncbi:hypothetical protein ACSBR2_004242 [Camellia fascicularis]
MHKWRVDTPTKIENFRREFNIPVNVHIRLMDKDAFIMPGDNYMSFPIVSIIEDGIRFSLNILFREMMYYYHLNPIQLAINTFRIINGIAELCHQHNARLTPFDIQYCYTICSLKSTNGISKYLKPRSTAYKMTVNLPDSNKGIGEDYPIFLGN